MLGSTEIVGGKTDGRTNRRKTVRLYRTLLKQVRQKQIVKILGGHIGTSSSNYRNLGRMDLNGP